MVLRNEIFLAYLNGEDIDLPEPITRSELFLAKLCGQDVETPAPITRYEEYLSALCGLSNSVPDPLTHLEKILAICLGDTGEVDPITREEALWLQYKDGGLTDALAANGGSCLIDGRNRYLLAR